MTDSERKACIDIDTKVSTEETKTEVEGSKETNTEDIIANDPEAEKAINNIKDEIEDKKIEDEIKADPSKEVISDKDDKAVVTGDKNTNTNSNVIEKEDDSEKPFENTEKIESSDKAEENKETEAKEEDNNGPVDLFEKEEETTEEVVVEETTSVVESETTTFEVEEEKVAPIVPAVEEKVEETAEVEAPKAVSINNSFVTASKEGTATIVANEGTIVSADAGEGVIVSVSGNTVSVKLATPEQTMVDVDVVDSLGNITTCVVSFN